MGAGARKGSMCGGSRGRVGAEKLKDVGDEQSTFLVAGASGLGLYVPHLGWGSHRPQREERPWGSGPRVAWTSWEALSSFQKNPSPTFQLLE